MLSSQSPKYQRRTVVRVIHNHYLYSYDVQEVILQVMDAYKAQGVPVGIDTVEQGYIAPLTTGVYDSYCAKRQWLNIAPTLAQQLLLVDEIMRAGKGMGGAKGDPMDG